MARGQAARTAPMQARVGADAGGGGSRLRGGAAGRPAARRGSRLAPLAVSVPIVIVLAVALVQAPPDSETGMQLRQDAGLGVVAEPSLWMPAWHPSILQEAHADHLTVCQSTAITSFTPPSFGRVQEIQFAVSNGTYGLGDEIDVRISFYRPDGMALDLSHLPGTAINRGPLNHTYLEMSIPGRTAEFLNKTGGNVLFYRYTVMPGDISHDLGYSYARALHAPSLRSGSIIVLCTLPAPGDPGSLRYESDVVVDAAVPTVRSVHSPDGNGTYGTGRSMCSGRQAG